MRKGLTRLDRVAVQVDENVIKSEGTSVKGLKSGVERRCLLCSLTFKASSVRIVFRLPRKWKPSALTDRELLPTKMFRGRRVLVYCTSQD